eukprot:IDg17406t1
MFGAPAGAPMLRANPSPPPRPSCEALRIETAKRDHAMRFRSQMWSARRVDLAGADVRRTLVYDVDDVAAPRVAPVHAPASDRAA